MCPLAELDRPIKCIFNINNAPTFLANHIIILPYLGFLFDLCNSTEVQGGNIKETKNTKTYSNPAAKEYMKM
jgi:hypothetical protein